MYSTCHFLNDETKKKRSGGATMRQRDRFLMTRTLDCSLVRDNRNENKIYCFPCDLLQIRMQIERKKALRRRDVFVTRTKRGLPINNSNVFADLFDKYKAVFETHYRACLHNKYK